MLDLTVLKFGGSSLRDKESRKKVASIIKKQKGKVIVVVSAIGRYPDAYATETLQSLISTSVTITECNRLLSVGEIISSVVLADECIHSGIKAISLSSAQAGLEVKNNKFLDVQVDKIKEVLQTYDVVILPGFQGIDSNGEITILEKGDSDYSAVYIAQQMGIHEVYIYSDVCGIYTGDPKYIISARLINHVSYEQALDLSRHKARIICPKALEEAQKDKDFVIYLCSTFIKDCSTRIDHEPTHIKTMSMDFDYTLVSFDETLKESDTNKIFEYMDMDTYMIHNKNMQELTTKYTKIDNYVKVHLVGCTLDKEDIYHLCNDLLCVKSAVEENSYYVSYKNKKQDIMLLHDILVKEE